MKLQLHALGLLYVLLAQSGVLPVAGAPLPLGKKIFGSGSSVRPAPARPASAARERPAPAASLPPPPQGLRMGDTGLAPEKNYYKEALGVGAVTAAAVSAPWWIPAALGKDHGKDDRGGYTPP